MERLTIRINGWAHGAEGISKEKLTGRYCRGKFESTACVEKLAEYEDLEEKGLLMKIPVAKGDTIHHLLYSDGKPKYVDSAEVLEVSDSRIWIDSYCFDYADIGKTVFLTEERAKQALKEMEKGK